MMLFAGLVGGCPLVFTHSSSNYIQVNDPDEPAQIADTSCEDFYLRFCQGEEHAFNDLVALCKDELSRFIYRIVGDYHETESLMIDTFAQLALNKKKFDVTGKASLKTYLCAIAKNLAAQHIRKRGRDSHLPFEEIAEVNVDGGESLYVALEKRESKQYLVDAMRALKKEYHAVLLLLYFEGMSYRQAGEAMNKTEKQIKALAFRAKAALRQKLEASGYVRS